MHALVCPLCRIALPPVEDVCPRDGHTGKQVSWLPAPYALSQRFNVLEPFAHGDTGSLYIADEPETGRRGLLKILAPVPSEQVAERQRLRRELVKQATLARTNLLLPLASGESDGSAWIFREWLDGVSLEVRLSREGALRQTEALAIAAQIASALDELHRGGVLHRDVKPGHIFLQPTPHGIPRALLIDAGLAATFANLRGAPLYGTPGYVAPEQLLGKLVSFRSDLYSLGCVLYRMLTGRPAFSGESLEQTLTAQRQGELPPLPSGLPHGIGALLQSILAKEPQDRPFSAQKLRRTLDPFLPDGALMEKQTTATFETVPKPTPSAAPQASGTLRPPPPPPARASLPPTSTTQRAASARDERTHQLDLDQIEEFLPPPRRPTSAPPPVPGSKVSSRPPAPPTAPIPSEKTQPIRLDQILGISTARKASSTPPPPTAARDEPADKPLSPAAAGSLFAAAALEPSEPTPAVMAPAEPTRPAAPSPKEASVDFSVAEAKSAQQPAPALAKATLVGMGGLSPAPAEPTAPAVPAMPPAAPTAPAAPSAPSAPTMAVLSERDHPTERIPTARVEPGSPSATESITGRGLAVLTGHGDPRRLLMYASAAVVGLAVLGVGASALLSDPEPERATQSEDYAAPPPLPASASAAAEPTPIAQPVAPTPRPVVEPIAAAPALKARESEPTPAAEPPAAKAVAAEPASEASSAASLARAEKREQARDERRAREKLEAESKKSERGATRASATVSGAEAFAAARDEARAHYAAKRFKEAAASYERAVKADPKNAGAYAGLGAARLQLGDAKAALKAYQQAAQLSPQTPGFQTALGRTYLALGDKPRAIAAYKKALALDPKNEAAKAALRELGG